MLGVFNALSSIRNSLSNAVDNLIRYIALLWQVFERYGWRFLIGFAAAWHFIQRLWLERERREKLASRKEAADPSRVAALNDRRQSFVERIGVVHEQTIQEKRRRDEEARLKRLREVERKIVGSGHRLGSQ